MADIYKKLLLTSGGGIISETQQADQTENTASVLIGLGGTGIDALRTIKTQVYERLKADDPDAVRKTYSHIRFIGVDTTRKTQGKEDDPHEEGMMALSQTEFFDITNPQIADLIQNQRLIDQHPELSWLNQRIDARQMGANGAGGIRQVGRTLLMSKSNEFRQKVLNALNEAKQGLSEPAVFVHIFAGLSGGTGAGTFLDACYIVKDVCKAVGGDVHIMGYFYLPDVNLARIPLAAGAVREYIPKNGYAAMQELDYCMALQYNGGAFTQQYQNGLKITWKESPVDMAHLICATDKDGNVIRNAYEYAMNVTAEYVLDYLTKPEDKKFGLDEQLSNFNTIYNQTLQKSVNGTNPCYCVIGASSASVPMREINTFLASELMEKFSVVTDKGRTPLQTDVEQVAMAALGSAGVKGPEEIYDSLVRELTKNAVDTYDTYEDDYKFVMQNGTADMQAWYEEQKNRKVGETEQNMSILGDETREESLIRRLQKEIDKVVRDLNRGPNFAYGLMDAANRKNLFSFIDGLIEKNQRVLGEEAQQTPIRKEDMDNSRYEFEQAGFLTKKKKFENYNYYMTEYYRNQQKTETYRMMATLLENTRKLLQDRARMYYQILKRVTDVLFHTFKENRQYLAVPVREDERFVLPLLTIAEIKDALLRRVDEIQNPAGLFELFMNRFLEDEETWVNEDENKISALVIHFFTKEVFRDYAERTMDAFLENKYGTTNIESLTKNIYQDWMLRLSKKSAPLFYSRWAAEGSEKAFVSVPQISKAVKDAAKNMYESNSLWEVKNSALTDRIYIMHSSWAIPIGDYRNNTEYEHTLFNSNLENGRHYYEGNPQEGQKFTNWNQLAPLTPYSLLLQGNVPQQALDIVAGPAALFDEALEAGIIRNDGHVMEITEEKREALMKLCDEMKLINVVKEADIPAAEAKIQELDALWNGILTESKFEIQRDGIAEINTRLVILKDRFVAAPGMQVEVQSFIWGWQNAKNMMETEKAALTAKIQTVTEKARVLPAYFDSLFTGVIAFKGKMLVYRPEDSFRETVVLSMMDEDFPFGDTVPMYQAYKTFQTIPEETRKEIVRIAKMRKNEESEVIKEVYPVLQTELSENRIQARLEMVDGKVEAPEIREFMREIVKAYQNFCILNDLS